jgi:hypothetical protein
LKDYGYLTQKVTFIGGGEEIKYTKLANLQEQTDQLEAYGEALLKVKERGNVPKEFFAVLRDMSVEEGTEFTNLLLSASDEEFNQYIQDWLDQQSAADTISKMLYQDEVEDVQQGIIDTFEKTPEELFGIGEESVKQFGEGFMSQLSNVMAQVREQLSITLGGLMPSVAFAGAGNSYTDNSTTNIYASDTSARGIIDAQEQNKVYEQHTRGW